MCTIDNGEDSILRGMFENLCYYTRKHVYDIKTEFSGSIDEFNKAYTKLAGKRREYSTRHYEKTWKIFEDDFYQ